MNEFKKCYNGHYYSNALAQCPYCPGGSSNSIAGTAVQEQFSGGDDGKTQVYGGLGDTATQLASGSGITTVTDEKTKFLNGSGGANIASDDSNRTQFGTEFVETIQGGQQIIQKAYRSARKLVGWLVSYSIDPMGVGFELYEGRNIIGREQECNITVDDRMISGKHATLLFRADSYALKDEMSAHGTFVNGENIGFDTFMLKDGDTILMGETTFKFKSSL